MEVKSKEFWEKVKEDYQPNSWRYSICALSTVFSVYWTIFLTKNEIIVLAKEFLNEMGYSHVDTLQYGMFLFYLEDDANIDEHCKVRRAFIDWCISKFS